MSVFHIILHQNTNSLKAGLMNTQLVLCTLTMAKATTEYVKRLQPSVDSFYNIAALESITDAPADRDVDYCHWAWTLGVTITFSKNTLPSWMGCWGVTCTCLIKKCLSSLVRVHINCIKIMLITSEIQIQFMREKEFLPNVFEYVSPTRK